MADGSYTYPLYNQRILEADKRSAGRYRGRKITPRRYLSRV